MATDIKDTTHAVDAAAVMRLLPARPRLLALVSCQVGALTLFVEGAAVAGESVEDLLGALVPGNR
jgi:hypothetical protein